MSDSRIQFQIQVILSLFPNWSNSVQKSVQLALSKSDLSSSQRCCQKAIRHPPPFPLPCPYVYRSLLDFPAN